MQVESCPQCGAPASASQRQCEYCSSPFFVTSLTYIGSIEPTAVKKYIGHYNALLRQAPEDAEANLGLAVCYLTSKVYPLADKHCQRALEARPDLGEVYYYSALSQLAGKRPGRHDRRTIQAIEALLETACALEPAAGHYDVLRAAIKFDYYRANGMRIPPPTDDEILGELGSKGVEQAELEKLLTVAKIPEEILHRMT